MRQCVAAMRLSSCDTQFRNESMGTTCAHYEHENNAEVAAWSTSLPPTTDTTLALGKPPCNTVPAMQYGITLGRPQLPGTPETLAV
jgi:hypothetical protein